MSSEEQVVEMAETLLLRAFKESMACAIVLNTKDGNLYTFGPGPADSPESARLAFKEFLELVLDAVTSGDPAKTIQIKPPS